uniref:Uncharacterized protein n=1 Tax=Magallana gigas TaxID=29159 RepID=K1PUT0_MAGGI
MILSTKKKFSKLPGEVLKTGANSFYATQFNFTMRRGTILKQLPDTDKDVLIKKWEEDIRLFLSPEAISVGDALELQEGSRVTVREFFLKFCFRLNKTLYILATKCIYQQANASQKSLKSLVRENKFMVSEKYVQYLLRIKMPGRKRKKLSRSKNGQSESKGSPKLFMEGDPIFCLMDMGVWWPGFVLDVCANDLENATILYNVDAYNENVCKNMV